MNKITRVWYEGTGDEKIFLDERTIDELRDESVVPSGDTPSKWAQLSVASLTVTILLDMKPLTGYELFCDGYGTTGELTGDDEPAFSEDYHDLLVEGPLKDEYKKLKQLSLANDSKLEYERILGDLKFHNAKSAYLRIRQNGRPRGQRFRRDNLVN